MICTMDYRDDYFVYVRDARHVWRFVYLARMARSGDEAIEWARAEGLALGNGEAADYMACPASAITTRTFEAQSGVIDREPGSGTRGR